MKEDEDSKNTIYLVQQITISREDEILILSRKTMCKLVVYFSYTNISHVPPEQKN